MSRTRRRKKHGDDRPAKDQRDGRGGVFGKGLPPMDFIRAVIRRDRRARDAETDKLERGAAEPDDVPAQPKPRAKWRWWRGM